MSDSDLKQRLAAILAADVAGYSRLMAADERATVAALDSARSVFRSQIERNQGRVIDMAGDSVLAVFETATGAVSAAITIQRDLDAPTAVPRDRQMRFRIGVHLGDVIEKGDGTIYGDGVNIAARLEGLAEPGGINISDAVRGAVRGKVSASFVDQGEQQVKNIPHPVRMFRVQEAGPTSMPSVADGVSSITVRDQPTIAVLPFNVLSEDSRVVFLADGLVEDVIALLARVAGFVLISQSSSFVFRDRKESISAIARQLRVRYIVEGSIRPVGDQVRVSTQLTEADSGRVLWSGRFESKRDEAADLQDAIARGIISELEPELTRAEIQLIRRLRPENVDAWGCYRQALGAIALKGWNEDSMSEARSQYRRAFTIDPTFALARAHFALLTALGRNTGVIQPSQTLADDAREAAEQAIRDDDGSSEVLGLAGCALSDLGQHDQGAESLERALQIDPSNAQAHVALGATQAILGQIDAGLERMRHGMRISPRDRRLGFWGWALSGFLLRCGRTEEALQEARASIGRDSKLHLARIVEAAALGELGRGDEARAALGTARRLRPLLTVNEVALSHGRRVAKQIEVLWQDNN